MKEDESVSDPEIENTPPKKRKKIPSSTSRVRKFQPVWLQQPAFKGWLQEVKGQSSSAFCSACSSTILLSGGKHDVESHANTQKHKKAVSGLKQTSSVKALFAASAVEHDDRKTNAVKEAEIHIATAFAAHPLAFQLIDHILPVFRQHKDVLDDVTLGRKKCTNIIKNIIGTVETEKLVKTLKTTPFSILVDESTSIQNGKYLCLLTRFFCPERKKVSVKLLQFIMLDSKDCSAEALFVQIEQSIVDKGLSMKMIIGLGTDNASVMVGSRNSLFTRLVKQNPKMVLMRCICHSAHIAAGNAGKSLPKEVEAFLRSLVTHVTSSPKRSAVLEEFQEFCGEAKSRLLKPATTRWLSLQHCIVRVLKHWQALRLYFIDAVNKENASESEKDLHRKLECPIIKAYFYFLKYALNTFNTFNGLFQSSKMLIAVLQDESVRLIRSLCQNFIQPQILSRSIYEIDEFNKSLYLPLNQIFIGSECKDQLKLVPHQLQIDEIYQNVLQFYVAATSELKKRLPHSDPLFKELRFLQAAVALKPEGRQLVPSISKVLETFEQFIDKNLVEEEWMALSVFFEQQRVETLSQLPLDEMWQVISEVQDFDDKHRFANIGVLAKLALSLPHANADAERIFSWMVDFVTKKRNLLGADTINSILVTKSAFHQDQNCCVDFKVTKDHLDLHNHKNTRGS